MMNLGYHHMAILIRLSITHQLRGQKWMMDDPAYSHEPFESAIARYMGEYFDHYRINRPGRPLLSTKDKPVDMSKDFMGDRETTLAIESLNRGGGKGREVPSDDRGIPSSGEGRGFKSHLRKRVNELVKLGILETAGKGFTISKMGLEMTRFYGVLSGITPLLQNLSLDWLRSGMTYYAGRYPGVGERDILKIMLNRQYPAASFLNIDDVLKMVKDGERTTISRGGRCR
jgi:hypothetical protein